MRKEIRKQQIGSEIYSPQYLIRIEEMMTATEPKASARMCRKTPYRFSLLV